MKYMLQSLFGLSCDALQLADEFFRRHSTGETGDLLSVLQDDDGRDRHDVKVSGDIRELVYIDLGEVDSRAQLCIRSLHDGSHHTAGAAPGGPEVDEG